MAFDEVFAFINLLEIECNIQTRFFLFWQWLKKRRYTFAFQLFQFSFDILETLNELNVDIELVHIL